MKVTVKCVSGAYDLEVAESDTIAALLSKAMEKHKVPKWADGVQLKAEAGDEDLAEDGSKTLAAAGVAAGASLSMRYYQDVLPTEAKKLKFQGITPGTAMPFIATKA
mmetsp:Transcript_5393/g.15947  ORF Transcript_5393/g.15947 Transcript_5393/m.15947 type:complete len:107 (-) Transcript_5393:160-480(-)|eukprot:CAMPEP_0168399756 /NCGR_PEP_ID=MMETSP0228-20121227/22251_1 /TAXON_ID=133427 /ORGANISM="Protoceratium reticulatum, Strain CCCM 535 (=CCMP 1889)" /LENGTH=106 /DNA_ID=CAMNT_0008413285 /DNA_START=55 /DNA_END=375 /DNA_ORIENTATION=+